MCSLSVTDVQFQGLNGINAITREPQGPEDTPEKLEAERVTAQELIDTGR